MSQRIRIAALPILFSIFVPLLLSAAPRAPTIREQVRQKPGETILDTLATGLRRIWEKTGSALDPFGGNGTPPSPGVGAPSHTTSDTGSALDPFGGR
jgi:hypothetical protein